MIQRPLKIRMARACDSESTMYLFVFVGAQIDHRTIKKLMHPLLLLERNFEDFSRPR